ESALDRRDDRAGLGHSLAIAAERLGEIGVIAADRSRLEFIGRVFHHAELGRHDRIVEEDRKDRDAAARRRLEIHAGEADCRVAPDVDAELLRRGEFRADSEAEPVTELCALAPAYIGSRRLGAPERYELITRAAAVMRHDRVRDIDGVEQIPDHAI